MAVHLILRKTIKPKNPKKLVKKTLVYSNDEDGFVTVTSKKTVTDINVDDSGKEYANV